MRLTPPSSFGPLPHPCRIVRIRSSDIVPPISPAYGVVGRTTSCSRVPLTLRSPSILPSCPSSTESQDRFHSFHVNETSFPDPERLPSTSVPTIVRFQTRPEPATVPLALPPLGRLLACFHGPNACARTARSPVCRRFLYRGPPTSRRSLTSAIDFGPRAQLTNPSSLTVRNTVSRVYEQFE